MTQQLPHQSIPYNISSRPRPDGTYTAGVKTPSGKWRDVRVPKSVAAAPNFKDAEKWILRNLPALASGAKPSDLAANPTATAGMRVRDLAPKVIAYREKENLADATIAEFKSNLNTHIVPFFGDRLAHELGSDDFLALRDALVAKGREPLTVRTIFKNFSLFFTTAIARKLDPELVKTGNPLRAAYEDRLLKMPEPRTKPIVYVSQADAEKLLTCPDVPEYRRVRYFAAFLSGLRDGELAGLTPISISTPPSRRCGSRARSPSPGRRTPARSSRATRRRTTRPGPFRSTRSSCPS